jgi:uncharacterized protein (DUF2236 family)
VAPIAASLPPPDPAFADATRDVADTCVDLFAELADKATNQAVLDALEKTHVAHNASILRTWPGHRDKIREYAAQVRDVKGWSARTRKDVVEVAALAQPVGVQKPQPTATPHGYEPLLHMITSAGSVDVLKHAATLVAAADITPEQRDDLRLAYTDTKKHLEELAVTNEAF